MFPTSAFNQAPIGYAYPGQQPPTSLYQSQYGGVAGFNHQVPPSYQQAQPPRGQSLPASGRQYPPPPGPYPQQQQPVPSSFRRQQRGQYPPPTTTSQHYEHRSHHGSKSKKHNKRRSVSPGGADEQGLYSDPEQQNKEHREQSEEHQVRSRSQSPALTGHSKQDGANDNDQQQQSQATEGTNGDAAQGGVAKSDAEQAVGEGEKRKSSSKKKKHHRRDRYDNYHLPPQPGAPIDINPNNPFQQLYPSQQYPQQPNYYGEYQNELPPQLKVHQQPLYNGYNQAYEESIRRGDVYRKQAKRSTRLPPEVKQQLLPHEDDQQNQHPPPAPPQPQQPYPYGPVQGYPQQPPPVPQQIQPYGGIHPPYNPYQPYGPPPTQPNYYGPAPTPFNALQPWTNGGAVGGPADQEIQRLRSHIHSLEGELHKLQRKLTKATLNNPEAAAAGGEQNGRSHRRSKRDETRSPRQTPVIVELNNTPGESVRERKHRHRTASNTSSQQGGHHTQQGSATAQRTGENTIGPQVPPPVSGISAQNQQATDARDHSRPGGNQTAEVDDKPAAIKTQREETAAQLAHAAAAHVNSRQAAVGVPPPQQASVPPPPPPVPQVGRPQLPNQQQHPQQPQQPKQPLPPQQQQQQQQHQQQQFLYQQGVLPPQGQQIRGPAPRLPVAGNIRFPNDPYQQPPPPLQQQQQFPNPQQRNPLPPNPNPNYNQSNNNELFDNDDEDDEERHKQDEQSRSAEKILDAFERFYVHRGKPSTVPMKVKYIPEDNNSNLKRPNQPSQQRNTNNNNRYRSASRESPSDSSSSASIYSNSPSPSRRSLYDNNQQKSCNGYHIRFTRERPTTRSYDE